MVFTYDFSIYFSVIMYFIILSSQVSWLRSQFPSLDIEVDGGVGPDTIHRCAEVFTIIRIDLRLYKSGLWVLHRLHITAGLVIGEGY